MTQPADQPQQPPQQPYQPPVQPSFGPPPQQPAFGQPAFGQPPAAGLPLTPAEAKQWSMLAHLGGIVLGFLAPLIVMLVFGPRDGFTKDQSTEALNFQITLLIGWVAATVLSVVGIGLFFYPLIWVAGLVFAILGGMAANRGEAYRYPFALRLIH